MLRSPSDAARALAMLDGDPGRTDRSSCRRVLAHHRSNGALWWLCAHLLSTDDTAGAARQRANAFDDDRTSARLRDALGLQDEDERLGVIGWPPPSARHSTSAFDLEVVAVVDDDDRVACARAVGPHAELVEAYELADGGVRTLLFAPHRGVAVADARASSRLVDAFAEARTADVWVVLPLGRLLPERLFDAVVDATRPTTRSTTDRLRTRRPA